MAQQKKKKKIPPSNCRTSDFQAVFSLWPI